MDEWKVLLYKFAKQLFTSTTILTVSELIYRLLLIMKEMIFYRGHYPMKRRYLKIIEYGFTFTKNAKFFLHISFIFNAIMIAVHLPKNIEELFEFYETFLKIMPIYVILHALKFQDNYIHTAEWIRSGNGLDYATGMASNYFHGYLNLQLPHKGDHFKGIRERINDYESSHGVRFPIKRLFILIPDSLRSRPKLESKIMERVTALETVKKDRAGVNRPFKNDVYTIKCEESGKVYYVSVEGATPLLSFWEAMEAGITSTPQMKAMQREILIQFYKSVKKFTTEHLDTSKECEIVYYNDFDDKGKETDVGYVLKCRIEQMLKEGLS